MYFQFGMCYNVKKCRIGEGTMTKSIKRSFYYYDLNLMKHQKDNFNKATLLRVKHQKEEYMSLMHI